MNLPNLSHLYKILKWHKNKEKEEKKHIGIFVPIPPELSKYFPKEGKEGEDGSPDHITVLYIGDIDPNLEENMVKIVSEICAKIKPFKVKILKKPKKFSNDDNQTVLYMPVSSKKLKSIHNVLKQEMLKNMVQVDCKYPEYKSHVTLEYVNEGDKPKYKNFRFSENKSFTIDSLWIWGTEEPYLIPLGKK